MMKGIGRLWRSSIGRKMLMALTGLALIGFLVGHLTGNLLVFKGRDALNDYAEWLKHSGPIVWGARLGVLAVFGLHVYLGIKLSQENREARPERYAHEATVQASLASRTMIRTGMLVLVYVIYHLLHFTFGVVQPDGYAAVEKLAGDASRHDVYAMVLHGFSNPLVSLSYLVAMLVLGLHLSHGIASFFQTIGFNHPRYEPKIRCASRAIAWILVAGYLTIPAAVLFGILKDGTA